jgi:hypothetical protein
MRYFLDTEYNGWGGALLSLALVPEDGGHELYLTLNCPDPLETWVEQNVIPYLNSVPKTLALPPLGRVDAAQELSAWLMREYEMQSLAHYPNVIEFEVLADWPEDISQICNLLLIGPGLIVDIPPVSFRLLQLPGFSTAANSNVPHNALHDARALRDQVLAME